VTGTFIVVAIVAFLAGLFVGTNVTAAVDLRLSSLPRRRED
jgi:hypothetical protein